VKDGMIIDCTREAYDSIEAANYSNLKAFEHSAALYQHRVTSPHEDCDAFVFGRLVHALTLEPETVDQRWVVWDGKVRRGKEWEQFQADHAGCEIMRGADFDPAANLANAVRTHPVASQWLADFSAEVTVVWTDAETGIACKCRLDGINTDLAFDLKTTVDSSDRAMSSAMLRYSYHAQAAMYLDALAAAGQPRSRYGLIAAEKAAPHKVRCYTLSEGAIEVGRTTYRKWLRTLAECRARDEWPAWLPGEDSVSELDLPAYAYDADDTFELQEAAE
jgi:hypothetical protein